MTRITSTFIFCNTARQLQGSYVSKILCVKSKESGSLGVGGGATLDQPVTITCIIEMVLAFTVKWPSS